MRRPASEWNLENILKGQEKVFRKLIEQQDELRIRIGQAYLDNIKRENVKKYLRQLKEKLQLLEEEIENSTKMIDRLGNFTEIEKTN